jgi:predicted nucleotidyltransferase
MKAYHLKQPKGVRMGKKKDGEKMVREIKEFKKKFYVDEIIIFGSVARGKMGKHSDIDLIVVSKKFGTKDFLKLFQNCMENGISAIQWIFYFTIKKSLTSLKRKFQLFQKL